MNEYIGEDGLTAAQRMAIFDKLPKAIRAVLSNAPYNYDVRDIWRFWHQMRRLRHTARWTATTMNRDWLRQRAVEQRVLHYISPKK